MVGKSRVEDHMITYGQMNLIFRARTLWREFAMWSRAYLISRIAGIGLTEDVFNRLYRIPVEFGDIMRIIFGDQAAETVIQQLSSTLVLFRDLIEAMISGDNEMANTKIQALYRNADERAAYLASLNPYWDQTQWKNLIQTFYSHSFDEIISILTGDPKNIDVFDQLLQHSDVMGDYFSQGLFGYLSQGNSPNHMISYVHGNWRSEIDSSR